MTLKLKSDLLEEFDSSVQAYTRCEQCGHVNWCVSSDSNRELCRDCYIL